MSGILDLTYELPETTERVAYDEEVFVDRDGWITVTQAGGRQRRVGRLRTPLTGDLYHVTPEAPLDRYTAPVTDIEIRVRHWGDDL